MISHQEKKIIATQIEQLHNKKHYKHLFKIIYEENNKYTINDNGIYLNINALPDITLHKIKKFLDSISINKNIIPVPKEYIPYNSETGSDKMFNNGKFQKMSIFDREAKLPISDVHSDTKNIFNQIQSESEENIIYSNKITVKPFNVLLND